MSNLELSKIIFDRLAQRYGPLLTHEELAQELRITPEALYNRRSRGRTGGMPQPLKNVHPLQFRAADIARWLSGDWGTPVPMAGEATKGRGPGRPRKVAGGEVGRVAARG